MMERRLILFSLPPQSQTPPYPFIQTSLLFPTLLFPKPVASHLLFLCLKSPTPPPSQPPPYQGSSPPPPSPQPHKYLTYKT